MSHVDLSPMHTACTCVSLSFYCSGDQNPNYSMWCHLGTILIGPKCQLTLLYLRSRVSFSFF